MTSPYLERIPRTEQQAAKDLESYRDHQPDIRFGHDALEHGLHRAIAQASFIRSETKRVVAGAHERIAMFAKTGEGHFSHAVRLTQDYVWIEEARKAHSKAILDREAYKQAINEREIQRSLGL